MVIPSSWKEAHAPIMIVSHLTPTSQSGLDSVRFEHLSEVYLCTRCSNHCAPETHSICAPLDSLTKDEPGQILSCIRPCHVAESRNHSHEHPAALLSAHRRNLAQFTSANYLGCPSLYHYDTDQLRFICTCRNSGRVQRKAHYGLSACLCVRRRGARILPCFSGIMFRIYDMKRRF